MIDCLNGKPLPLIQAHQQRFQKVYAPTEIELKALHPDVFCVRTLDREVSGIVDLGERNDT